MIRKFLYSLISISTLLLAGCSADEPFSLPGADGNTTITLVVPSTELALANTRATDTNPLAKVNASEGVIKKLSVIGFYTTDDYKAHHFFYELTDEAAVNVDNIYRSYKISVVPANYKLYVLANATVDDGDDTSLRSDLEGNETKDRLEERVKSLIYNYSTTALPKAADGLPMAKSLEADVKSNRNTQVVVDLEYVCAKVRLTVIYNNAFNAPFKIDQLDVNNAMLSNKVFASVNPTAGDSKNYVKVGGQHYDFPTDKEDWEIGDWTNLPSNANSDPLNGFTEENAKTGSEGWSSFVWQSTVYVPECLGKGNSTTSLLLKTAKGNKSIYVGCSSTANKHDENKGGNIERGHFYDIVAMVTEAGEIEYLYNVLPWNLQNITVELAGDSRLFVGTTEVATVSGQEPAEIEYRTNVNNLVFESSTREFDGKIYKLFDVSEDKGSGNIIVKLNGDLPLQSNTIRDSGMGFWVVAGSIRKWVSVKEIDLKAYVRILPKTRTLSIQNIVNEPDYPIWLDYATNADNLTLKLISLSNSNTNTGYDATNLRGISVEICNSDSTAVTRKLSLKEIMDDGGNLFKSSYLKANKSFPDDGFIKLLINDPTDASYFSKEIKVTFEASITNEGVSPAKAEVTILPNPTVYTIHFKAIGSAWGTPHIYVYQPLLYNGLPVYGTSNSNTINWLEYDFTGNKAFCGWKKDGGEVDNMQSTYYKTDISFGGETVTGYHVGSDWGDAGSNFVAPRYQSVTLVDYTKSSCSLCNPNGHGSTWPGIGMTKETGENDGWWKIELPLLVKPGLALVMFTNGHVEKSYDGLLRHPADQEPGIPLPNYSDREAWFLLDSDHGYTNCSFSDDKRTSYDTTPKMTIYCYDTEGWGKMSVQVNGKGWPGTSMTKISGDYGIPLYEASVPVDAKKLIFNNNGGGKQIIIEQSTAFAENTYFNNSSTTTGKLTLPTVTSSQKLFLVWLSDNLNSNPYVYRFNKGGSSQTWESDDVKSQKMTQVKGRVFYYIEDGTYHDIIVKTDSKQSNDIYNYESNKIQYVDSK